MRISDLCFAQRVAVVACLIVSAVGCGPGLVTPDKHKGPPVSVLTASVTGALGLELPVDGVRGALIWSAYDPMLLTCLEQVAPFAGTLDPYGNPEDLEIAQQMSLCLTLHLRSTVESDSVLLEPTFPASFEIPLYVLPDPSLLTGDDDALLGLASVSVYVDGNANGQLDLVQPGTQVADDTIIGSSAAVSEEDLQHALIVYREGNMSSLWRLYEAIYGCPSSVPQGFSVVTIEIAEDQQSVSCTVSEGPIGVRLSDSAAMRNEICLPQPEQGRFVEPSDDVALPGGAAVACDGDTVYFSTDPDAVCPLIGHYDLYGCRDTSSEAACRATFFDYTLDPPAWWPCNTSNGVFFWPSEPAATGGLDQIGVVSARGIETFELSSLSVHIDGPDGQVTLTGDAFVLHDNDGNGWVNQGDVVEVHETENVFDANTPEGLYGLQVLVDDEIVFTSQYSPSVITPVELPLHQLSILDAPNDGDVLFTIESRAGEGSYALADLQLVIALFGKAYENMPSDMMTLIDRDDDGLFGAGDAIEVRLSDNVSEWALPQLHDQNHNFVVLQARTAVNIYTSITGGGYGSTVWGRFTAFMTALSAPLTPELDAVATLHIENADPFPLANIGGYWSISATSENIYAADLNASFFTHDDADADGLVSRGDTLTLNEITPVIDAGHAVQGGYHYVSLTAPDGSGHTVWGPLR